MTPKTEITLIGHVTDVRGSGLTAILVDYEQDSAPTITVGDEDILVGQLGSYVLIKQGSVSTVGMITRMSEQEKIVPVDQDVGPRDGTKAIHIVRTIDISPLGTLGAEGEFMRGVSTFPTTGAEVHVTGPSVLVTMFAKFQSSGYEIGNLSANKDLKVCFEPSALFGRHFAILGQTGAGKSWTVANLVQRAVKIMPKAHIILLDLHGEYSWTDQSGKRSMAFDDEIVRRIDARSLEIPYWLMTYAELCELLIDHSEREAANQTAFFRDAVFHLKSEENKKVGLARVSVDTPIFFSLDTLLQKFRNENNRMIPKEKGAGDKQGPMYGQFDRFLIRLESRLNDVRYDFLLKPKIRNSSDSLSGLLRDFVGLGEPKRPVTIIDLSSVPFDVRPTVAAQIGRLAFEFNYWNPQYRDFPILLICEEAHSYIPKAAETQFAGSRKSMERIAKEGRKYGVGLGIVSQRPNEVSETVLSQCGTFVCLRITNPTDQAYVKNLVPEAERDLVDILAGLGRGEAMALGEAVPLPTKLKFYPPHPPPNSDDVKFFERWKDGPDDLNVDEIVDRWRQQRRVDD